MRILVLIALFLPAFAVAQNVAVKVEIREDLGSKVRVVGRVPEQKTRNLSFVRSIGGFDKLGERVSEVALKDGSGNVVSYLSPIPGEYIADADIAEFSYLIDLSPRKEQNAAAHVSWLANGVGALMLADMLPRVGTGYSPLVNIQFSIPDGWMDKAGTESTSPVRVEDAVYVVGKGIQRRSINVGNSQINIIKSGEWQFTEQDIDDALTEIYGEYKRVFASGPDEFTVAVLKFPNTTKHAGETLRLSRLTRRFERNRCSGFTNSFGTSCFICGSRTV
jgi:hypothetical protein